MRAGTEQAAGMLSGQLFGPGGNTTLEYWIKQGRKMNIDLDSWEAGYADGQYGRSPQCAIGLDQVSYLSGFCHGRARRAQSRTKSPPLLRSLERCA